MVKKVFITREIPAVGLEMLSNKGYQIDVYPGSDIPSQKKIISYLKKKPYDAVLTSLNDQIDRSVFDSVPTAKIYANFATGFDNIDIVEAKRQGITVTNAPAELSSEAVAEHTIALMLALAARIVEADEYVRRGKYKGWSAMNFIGMDILGKKLGLIGAGRIGARVAHYAKGLGMDIFYTDISRNEHIEKESGAHFVGSTEELLPMVDVVSIHVPLLDSTKHLINETSLRLMKPTAYLINTSRGAVVDERALTLALKTGVIRAAALDVFEFEPKLSPGLSKLQNVILTPHIASASTEARNQMAEIAADNIIDYFEGRVPRNSVTN